MKKIKEFINLVKKSPKIVHLFLVSLFRDLRLKERILILSLSLIFFLSSSWFLFNYYIKNTRIAPAKGGTYIEGIVGKPEYINPILAKGNETDLSLSQLIFSGLMKYDRDGNLVNDVAASWSISDDKTTYTVKIRDDVVFHDGEPLTAEDVIFTINTIKNRRFNSPLRFNWTTTEVSKGNGNEVVFVLKEPFTPFLHNLTFGILPKHIWQDIGPSDFLLSKYNKEEPIGSGPYIFYRNDTNESDSISQIILKANDNYHLGAPYIETIIFKFYPSEDLAIQALNEKQVTGLNDISHANVDKLNLEEVNIYEVSLPRYYAVFLNIYESEVLASDSVRKSLAWAACQEDIIQEVFQGKGKVVDSPVITIGMEGVEGFEKRGCSVEKAKELLEDDKWKLKEYSAQQENSQEEQEDEEEQDGQQEDSQEEALQEELNSSGIDEIYYNEDLGPLKVTLTVPDYPKLVETAEILKKQWAQAGIYCEIEVLSIGDLKTSKIEPRAYEALLFGEVLTLDPDPRPYWHSSQRKDPGQNIANYNNKKVDDLLDKGKEEVNEEVRRKIYEEFQLQINKDIPAIFLYSSYYLYPVREEVKGIKLDLISATAKRFSNIHEWYLEQKRTMP
ncbi:MAG: hypothetical protein GF335_04915 [Candidatus Moranbacteria bacterium]|nr:hypothetical protein [Candidatus Moranbacteria bacterium]